jgi:hypothetical protein
MNGLVDAWVACAGMGATIFNSACELTSRGRHRIRYSQSSESADSDERSSAMVLFSHGTELDAVMMMMMMMMMMCRCCRQARSCGLDKSDGR